MFLKTLKSKIAVFVLGSIFFFGILATITVFFLTYNSLITREKNSMSFLTQTAADGIRLLIDDRLRMSKIVAGCAEVVDYLSQENPILQDPEVLKLLGRFDPEEYLAVYLMDTNGNTLVSTDPSFVGKNYSFRSYFKQAMNDNPSVDVAVGVTSGEMGFYFSHPVENERKEIVGALVAKLKPELVHGRISRSPLVARQPENTHIYLASEDGIIISSNNSERLLHPISYLPKEKIDEIIEKRQFPEISSEHIFDLPFDKVIKTEKAGSFESLDEIDNEKEILSVSRLNVTPDYYLFLSVSTSGIVGQSLFFSTVLAGFVLVAAVACGIVIFVLISRFLKPLDELKEISECVREGDLNVKATNISTDELGQLSLAFNQMIDEIRHTRQTLNDEVDKKTKTLQEKLTQLERVNKLMVARELKMAEYKKLLKETKHK
jgi:C4-dicarboxylate-specific signal transduction histidine kinase